MQIGPGVRAVQVQPHKDHEDSSCFYLKRIDGTVEDFSVSKCINNLFPAFGELRAVMVRLATCFTAQIHCSISSACRNSNPAVEGHRNIR